MPANFIGTIVIDRLQLFGRHGVSPQELAVGNMFEITVRLRFEASQPMLTDRLDPTVNYAEVVELVRREMEFPSKLLENLACRIYRAITWRYPQIVGGDIEVFKLHPPIPSHMEKAGFCFSW